MSEIRIAQLEVNNLLRKIVLIKIMTLFILIITGSLAVAEPQVSGKAAVLIDAKSGQVLYAKNEHEPLPPASTTKVLTALLALENVGIYDQVTGGKNPTVVEPSAIGLREGETISLENLLYSLLLKSANDAAIAIAEHVSGSVPEFARLMNQRAQELGTKNSNFVNPNGLPEKGHVSTAYDLAVITAQAMKNPVFREIVTTKVKTIPRENDDDIKWLQNHNKLLWRYDSANGVKTGYTKEAKQCLIASAADEELEIIAVILGAEGNNVWSDATTLLDYGFAGYTTVEYKKPGLVVKTAKAANGTADVMLATAEGLFYTLKKGAKTGEMTEEIIINEEIEAPVKKNQVLGQMKLFMNGEQLGSVDLVAVAGVPVREIIADKDNPVYVFLAGGLVLGLFVWWNVARHRRIRRKRAEKWYNKGRIR